MSHALAAVVLLGGVQRQLAGGGELGRHVGEVVADRLVLPDRLAEASRAPGRRRRASSNAAAADAERPGGHLDAAGLEALHHLREPLALVAAEQRVGRGAVVVEDSSQLSTPL